MYSVEGRSAATAATADHAVACLWNPHATQIIKVVEVCLIRSGGAAGGGSPLTFRRASVRGTPASTVTPDIDNDHRRAVAPPSGALLDLAAYTVQPTLELPEMYAAGSPNIRAAGFLQPFPEGILVGPGTGLAIVQLQAIAHPVSEITYHWLEDWED